MISIRILGRIQVRGYENITGFLSGYANCVYDDNGESCNPVYEFEVNGTTYFSTSIFSGEKGYFKHNEIVYYNPNNPSENVIILKSGPEFIVGIIIIVVTILSIIFEKIIVKKRLKKLEDITI